MKLQQIIFVSVDGPGDFTLRFNQFARKDPSLPIVYEYKNAIRDIQTCQAEIYI